MEGNVRHVCADRRNIDALRTGLNGDFDAVIDNVAYEPGDSRTLLNLLRGRVGHYVLTSTAFVYPDVETRWKGPSAIVHEFDAPLEVLLDGAAVEIDGSRARKEEARPGHLTGHALYVWNKRRLEREVIAMAAEGGLRTTVIRPFFQIVGPNTEDGRFAWFWLRVQDGGPIWLPDSARLHAGPCQLAFSGDVARVLAAAAAKPPAEYAVYNVAQPELWTYEEYLRLMAEVAGTDIEIRYAPLDELNHSPFAIDGVYRIPLPYRVALDVHAAEVAFGIHWTPMRDWIAETGTWMTAHYARAQPAWFALRDRERTWHGRTTLV